ncbi:MAG TPA: SpoIVB peptidase S55 domain-containing protein, partial [Limnochorda sp.]
MPVRVKPRFMCLVMAAVVWLLRGWGAAAEPGPVWDGRLLPVEAVAPGMRGTAYTVVQGTKIEPFDVLFLGVLPGAGPAGDLLLVETSGPLIEKTGGIVSGMSGSPVYVDGQLVGAIAYGFSYADHRVGLVTPIGDMLELLDRMAPPETGAPDETASTSRSVPRQVVLAPGELQAAQLAARVPEGTEVLVPLATPLLAGGFGPRALSLIERWASRLPGGPFLTVPTGSRPAGAGQEPVTFQPGSAFGVQLLGGDVDLSALGTVT